MANETVDLTQQVTDKMPADYDVGALVERAQTSMGVPTSTFWAFHDFSAAGEFVENVSITTGDAFVNSVSQIAVSITELDPNTGRPFIGSADMQVLNVAPFDDSTILVRGHVHWDHVLPVRLNLVILN